MANEIIYLKYTAVSKNTEFSVQKKHLCTTEFCNFKRQYARIADYEIQLQSMP